MKVYVALTALLFGILTAVHVWRAVIEPSARNPWFFSITALSAVLCLWAIRLWRRMESTSSGSRRA